MPEASWWHRPVQTTRATGSNAARDSARVINRCRTSSGGLTKVWTWFLRESRRDDCSGLRMQTLLAPHAQFPGSTFSFSERALLTLRPPFRNDWPSRIQDMEGGLNKMSLRKFERTILDCGNGHRGSPKLPDCGYAGGHTHAVGPGALHGRCQYILRRA
jgi:hypothetical protein